MKVTNMATKNRQNQSKHDQMVKREIKKYEQNGWNVLADLSGYSKPPLIGRKRPDIKAVKRGTTHLVEIETKRSMVTDKSQHSTFRRHASQKPKTRFILKEVK